MMKRARRRFGTRLAAASLLVLWTAAASAADPARLELKKGDRIIIIGNTLAERMQYYGHFETLLHARFPELELVVHDLGWSADEVALRPRQAHFDDHGHTLEDEKPDVLVAAFGFNESFARAQRASRSSAATSRSSSKNRRPPSTTARPPRSSSCSRRSPRKT